VVEAVGVVGVVEAVGVVGIAVVTAIVSRVGMALRVVVPTFWDAVVVATLCVDPKPQSGDEHSTQVPEVSQSPLAPRVTHLACAGAIMHFL